MPPADLGRMSKLLSGRMPDQSSPDEVLASYTLARDNGVRIGSVIRVLTPTPAQLRLAQKVGPSNVSRAALAAVPRRSLRVVGLVVAENEFHYGQGAATTCSDQGVRGGGESPCAGAGRSYYVRLRHGAADLPAFDSQLRPLGSVGADDLDIDAAAVQRRDQAAGRGLVGAGRPGRAGRAGRPRAGRRPAVRHRAG